MDQHHVEGLGIVRFETFDNETGQGSQHKRRPTYNFGHLQNTPPVWGHLQSQRQ